MGFVSLLSRPPSTGRAFFSNGKTQLPPERSSGYAYASRHIRLVCRRMRGWIGCGNAANKAGYDLFELQRRFPGRESEGLCLIFFNLPSHKPSFSYQKPGLQSMCLSGMHFPGLPHSGRETINFIRRRVGIAKSCQPNFPPGRWKEDCAGIRKMKAIQTLASPGYWKGCMGPCIQRLICSGKPVFPRHIQGVGCRGNMIKHGLGRGPGCG